MGINEEFTVGVQIENCGNDMLEIISFELINPPVDILIKEQLIMNISNLYYGNSERFINLKDGKIVSDKKRIQKSL